MKLAARMDRLGTETAFEVLAKARRLEAEGMDVVHLEIGEPDFDTPSNVVEAGPQRPRGRLHALRTVAWTAGGAGAHSRRRSSRRRGGYPSPPTTS